MDIREIAEIERELDTDAIKAKEMYQKLSFREKLKHLWLYHKSKFYIVLFLAVVGFLVSILSPKPTPDANLRIKFINAYVEGLLDETNIIETDYEAYLGEDNTCEMAFTYTKFDPDNEIQSGQNLESMMVEVVTCNLELFLFDEYSMKRLCPTGFIMDLTTCLDADVLTVWQEHLVYGEDLEGNVVPMAIDITDTAYVEDKGIQGDKIFLSFVINSSNVDITKNFVEYILEYES